MATFLNVQTVLFDPFVGGAINQVVGYNPNRTALHMWSILALVSLWVRPVGGDGVLINEGINLDPGTPDTDRQGIRLSLSNDGDIVKSAWFCNGANFSPVRIFVAETIEGTAQSKVTNGIQTNVNGLKSCECGPLKLAIDRAKSLALRLDNFRASNQ